MLAELRRELPSVRALEGSAEAIPVPDASVDAVLAGHSLHWFDMDVAGPEIARVLVPGGTLAGLWNVLDDRIAWIAELAAVAGPAAVGPRDTLTRWRTATSGAYLPASGISHLFDRPEQAEFPHAQRRTVDSLVEALATRAGVLVMSEPERAATLDRIRAFLVGRAETVGEFELPMMTGVLRVRRGDQGVLEQAQAPGCCPPRPFRSVAMLRPWRSRGSGLLTGRRSGQCGSPPCPTRRRPSVPPTPTG
jgi:SAM-dependent methyltransferase